MIINNSPTPSAMTITLTEQEHDDLWNEAAQHAPSQCTPDSEVAICPMPKQLGTGHELAVKLYPDCWLYIWH